MAKFKGSSQENLSPLTPFPGSTNGTTYYTCELCGENGLDEYDMKSHILIAHSEGVNCPICGLEGSCAEEIQWHVNMEHCFDDTTSANSHDSPWSPFNTKRLRSDDSGILQLTSENSQSEEPSRLTGSTQNVSPTFSSGRAVKGNAAKGRVQSSLDNQMAQLSERQERERLKLQEQRQLERLQEEYGMSSRGSESQQIEVHLERQYSSGAIDLVTFHELKRDSKQSTIAPFDNNQTCARGVIGTLKQFLATKAGPNRGIVYRFCSAADHYAGAPGDKGWGCGYRNLQMLLSGLRDEPVYKQNLFNGRDQMPSIYRIQQLIEEAWAKGFDRKGRDQLGGKLCTTRKWIGATEVATFLLSMRVRCQVVDFWQSTGPQGTHPRLIEWLTTYFEDPSRIFKPPLYLQHDGHSRTVVGLRKTAEKVHLLIFDPGKNTETMKNLVTGGFGRLSVIQFPADNLKWKKAYQIVTVLEGFLTEAEYETSKIITSIRIP